MQKSNLLEIIDMMINSFKSDSKQFNFIFNMGNTYENITANASLGTGSIMSGGKIVAIESTTHVTESCQKFLDDYEQSADIHIRQKYITVLEELKTELEKEKPNGNLLKNILDKSVNILPNVISSVLSHLVVSSIGI